MIKSLWRRLLKPTTLLRLGFGLMYLYSGLDLLRHPSAWSWALRGLPLKLQQIIEAVGPNQYLMLQGVGELLLAAAFLLWFAPRRAVTAAAWLAALEMFLILWWVGLDAITFRDLGLLGAALALALLSRRSIYVR